MKNAIFTICVGKDYQKMSEATHLNIRAYADRIGADFIVISESKCSSPHWEKLLAITELLKKYDRLIYFDTDLIIRKDCPNLFDEVPKDKIGLFNEAPFTYRSRELMIDACKVYDIKLPNWDGRYFNTGVMVLSRQHRWMFQKPEIEYCSFYEQTYLNVKFAKEIPEIFDLPYKFNRMTCMDRYTGEERFSSYIIHYAGYPNLSFVLDLIPKDIKKWEEAKGIYEYQKHILVKVSAGLGDQIDAEPTVRFAAKHLYPNDDINVLTHWPEIFRHIDGIKVWKHGEFNSNSDVPYYIMETHQSPLTMTWAVVSNLLCHTVDFSSISALHRTLPLEDKQIKLEVVQKDIDSLGSLVQGVSLAELVLVHPGRHWTTKTFPPKWWEDLIVGLVKQGLKVCLIGKNEEKTRGTLDINYPAGVLDLRDLLSLGELFALISKAKVLVTNDSAPVHIAGAFDNYIVLVPSCKHPDHILPWRNGQQHYKATALYKKLFINDVSSHPTQVYETRVDFVVKDWTDYLPDVDIVVEKAAEFNRS